MWVRGAALSAAHAAHYTGKMARRTADATRAQGRPRGRAAARLRSGKAQARRPTKAAHGELPQWTPAEIEEAFRRFKAAANPAPQKRACSTSTRSRLLVAVVLSAQATDAGVNKATPALFAAADTPEKWSRSARSGARPHQDHLLRRVGGGEQRRRRLVDAGIGRLRRQHHRDQQGERDDVLQFAARRRVGGRKRRNASSISAFVHCGISPCAGLAVGLGLRLARL